MVLEDTVKIYGTNISVTANHAMVGRTVHCMVVPWLTCVLPIQLAEMSVKITSVSGQLFYIFILLF